MKELLLLLLTGGVLLLFQNCNSTDEEVLEVEFLSQDKEGWFSEICLVSGTDTLLKEVCPNHKKWAFRSLYDAFPQENVNSIEYKWSCKLRGILNQDSLFQKAYDYSAYNNIISLGLQKLDFTNRDSMISFIMNNFFIPSYYLEPTILSWSNCEKDYRNEIEKMIYNSNQVNSDGIPNWVIGLDTCQLSEIELVDSTIATLNHNQLILSFSGCKWMELNKNLRLKPYFLVTLINEKGGPSAKIELINKLYYYHWLEM